MTQEFNPALVQNPGATVSSEADHVVSGLMEFSDASDDGLRIDRSLPQQAQTQDANVAELPQRQVETPPDAVFEAQQKKTQASEQPQQQARVQTGVEDDSHVQKRRHDNRQERFDTQARGSLSEADFSALLDSLDSSSDLAEATRRAALLQKEQQLQTQLSEARSTMAEVNEQLNRLQVKESLQDTLKSAKYEAAQRQEAAQAKPNRPAPVKPAANLSKIADAAQARVNVEAAPAKPTISAEAVLRNDPGLDAIMNKVEQETKAPVRKHILPIIAPEAKAQEQLAAEIAVEESGHRQLAAEIEGNEEASRLSVLQAQYSAKAQQQEVAQKSTSLQNELIDVKSAIQNLDE